MNHNNTFFRYLKTIPFSIFTEKIRNTNVDCIFLPQELEQSGRKVNLKSLAARWLIKEILIEHYQGTISYLQVSISSLKNGKPLLTIHQEAIKQNHHISISHSKNYISVLVLIEKG